MKTSIHSLADVVQYATDYGAPGMESWLSRSRVKVLGLFENIPRFERPGWILAMVSKYGMTNRIVVLLTNTPGQFVVKWYPTDLPIPWDTYQGDENGPASLINGTR